MNYIEMEGKVIAVTDAAILFQTEVDDGDVQAWIPKSRITVEGIDGIDYEFEKNEEIIIEIPEWLAKEKELLW